MRHDQELFEQLSAAHDATVTELAVLRSRIAGNAAQPQPHRPPPERTDDLAALAGRVATLLSTLPRP